VVDREIYGETASQARGPVVRDRERWRLFTASRNGRDEIEEEERDGRVEQGGVRPPPPMFVSPNASRERRARCVALSNAEQHGGGQRSLSLAHAIPRGERTPVTYVQAHARRVY